MHFISPDIALDFCLCILLFWGDLRHLRVALYHGQKYTEWCVHLVCKEGCFNFPVDGLHLPFGRVQTEDYPKCPEHTLQLWLYSRPTVTLWKHKGLSEILDVESCWQSILWFNLEEAQTTPVLQMFARFLKLHLKYLLCNRVKCCNLALHSVCFSVCLRKSHWNRYLQSFYKASTPNWLSLFGVFFFILNLAIYTQSSSEHQLFSSIWNHVALKMWAFKLLCNLTLRCWLLILQAVLWLMSFQSKDGTLDFSGGHGFLSKIKDCLMHLICIGFSTRTGGTAGLIQKYDSRKINIVCSE